MGNNILMRNNTKVPMAYIRRMLMKNHSTSSIEEHTCLISLVEYTKPTDMVNNLIWVIEENQTWGTILSFQVIYSVDAAHAEALF